MEQAMAEVKMIVEGVYSAKAAKELAALGQGGLCLNCPVCSFPNCGFGKGV